MENRLPPARSGKISKVFVEKLRRLGASARLLRELAPHMEENMEEVATVELSYLEICQLLESGTVVEGSPLYVKLRAARDAFLRQPKVYGNGLRGYLKIKEKDSK